MKRSVVFFAAKEQAVYKEEEFCADLQADQLLVKLDYDLISTGTETANYLCLPNTVTGEKGFPHYPGYTASGHIEAIGSGVSRFKVGDRVAVKYATHRSRVVMPEKYLYPVPAGVSQQAAAFAYLATFPMLGVRKLELQLGEAVMVAGAGLLGQLAIAFARYSGACPVLACDFSAARRELALQSGADYALDPGEANFTQKVTGLTNGGPQGVIEVTGNSKALQQALEYVAREGRISLLGCTRVSDAAIDFYKYVHRRGVRLIGSHNSARPSYESNSGGWTTGDDYATFFKLLERRGLQIDSLISKTILPSEAEQVYRELAAPGNPYLGVLLDWRNTD